MITPTDYNNIGGLDLSNQVYPSYFKPSPSKLDYTKGYLYRYYVQKINDSTIIEVNKDLYNNISVKCIATNSQGTDFVISNEVTIEP